MRRCLRNYLLGAEGCDDAGLFEGPGGFGMVPAIKGTPDVALTMRAIPAAASPFDGNGKAEIAVPFERPILCR